MMNNKPTTPSSTSSTTNNSIIGATVASATQQQNLSSVRHNNKFREMLNNDIYSIIMSFLDLMNQSLFYSFLRSDDNVDQHQSDDELLKFIFPSLTRSSTSKTTSNSSDNDNSNKQSNKISELSEITFILHCLGLLNQLKSAITFNSLPPLEILKVDLYKECEFYISLLESIKNEYIYNKRVDPFKLFKFVLNLNSLAKYIGFGLSHFNLKTKSLKDSYFTTFSALPYLKKVKETLLEKFEPLQLFEKYHMPIPTREMKEILKQMTFRSNRYVNSFYYSTYGYSLCMEIIRITEHEVMEEDFVHTLSHSFKLNYLKDLHIWIDFRKVNSKNEKLFFENLLKIVSNLNSSLNLLYLDINYYENEDQIVKFIQVLNMNSNIQQSSNKKKQQQQPIILNHLTLSTYTEQKDIDPFVSVGSSTAATTSSGSKKQQGSSSESSSLLLSDYFTHHLKHLTLIDKNNFNVLNRLIFKNSTTSCATTDDQHNHHHQTSKLEQLTISNIDYLYLFLNSHPSLKRINFYGNNLNSSSSAGGGVGSAGSSGGNESFNDTNLIKESFANLKCLDTVFIDDRNESLGYSILGNMGIYINNIIFKYSKNGYTLSSLIECFKRHSRSVNKLTIIDNTNFSTNIQLLCKIVSSFLFDNILNQLVIHTKHVSLLNELTYSIHHMFSPTELELKYLQIVKKLNSIDFILFIGKSNNSSSNNASMVGANNVNTITIIHTIPITGEFNIKDEIIDKRVEIESVMSNVCILGSNMQLQDQQTADIHHNFRPPFNHYLFYRFLHSLSFSNNLTLTRSSLYQLMIVK